MSSAQKLTLGAALAAVVVAGILGLRQASRLMDANRNLTAQIRQLTRERDEALNRLPHKRTPHLPAPALQASSNLVAELPEDMPPTNHLLQLIKGDPPKLTPGQIESYLEANHRDAASLLAMARLTGDKAFLKEAMEKFPNDPRVAFDAVWKSETPEERREWLDKLKQNAPDNALAGYLSALDHFKAGQTGQAIQELIAASGKPELKDYSWDYILTASDAWRSAGYSEAEARMLAAWRLNLPHLQQLKLLNQSVMDVVGAYRQAGDEASAQAALEYNLQLGELLSDSTQDLLISRLVGIAIQRNALEGLDPNSPFGPSGQTVGDALLQLKQQRAAIKTMADLTLHLHESMSGDDWIAYLDRTQMFGELNAMEWLLAKYAQDGQVP